MSSRPAMTFRYGVFPPEKPKPAVKAEEAKPGVKVIEGPEKKQAKCGHCGAKLEYTELDVRVEVFCSMGDTDSESGFDCPACKSWVRVRR